MKLNFTILTALYLALFLGLLSFIRPSGKPDDDESKLTGNEYQTAIEKNAADMMEKGKEIFRYETFGDEAFWSDKLQLHKAIMGEKNGGIGPGLTPKAALAAGLKVDVDILPNDIKKKIAAGEMLDDVNATIALIKLKAVVGVVGTFADDGSLKAIGLTCAVCHSTVDDETGIGQRLDGWPNRDLNVGAIISMAPDLSAFTDLLGVDVATVKKVLASWGPGKFDAQLNLDGKAFRPDGKPAATLIPEAYGHAGSNNHTWTGGWGTVTYWNAFVANLEMQGSGTFVDARLNNKEQFPVAAKAGFGNKRNADDLISDKLAALQFYQLAMPAPEAPKTSYVKEGAERGKIVFNGKAKCATCHVPPLFTEPGQNTHTAAEIGIDDFQSNRSPDKTYVTQTLKGLWAHQKGGFYHDGRFATLPDVVNHYNGFMKLNLTDQEKNDLVQYLLSI